MEFTLRAVEPGDGPGLDALLRTEAQTTALGLTTRYRHDIHASLVAQHPSLFGVVATATGIDGLVGMATAFLDDVQIGGTTLPCVHLENLKVRHDVRRQGLGRQLAEWRIAEGRRRSGRDGVVMAGVDATNAASLATARRWATTLLGPVRVVIARPRSRPPTAGGLRFRPIEDRDIEAVVDGVNAFYTDHDLFPRQTSETLAASLAPTALGMPIRRYRVATDRDGPVIAGASVTERFELMTDRLERIPRPLELLGKIVPVFPPDRVIRTIEVSLAWHAPGRVDAGRALWDAIRFEWRDRTTNVVGLADPRGPIAEVFRAGLSFAPRVRLMIPVRSPVALDEGRPVYLWR